MTGIFSRSPRILQLGIFCADARSLFYGIFLSIFLHFLLYYFIKIEPISVCKKYGV